MYAYYWYVLREMDMYCMCNDIKDILYKWVARTRQLCSFVWLLKNALKNLYMLVKLTPGFTQIGYISTTAKPFSDWPATHTHTHTRIHTGIDMVMWASRNTLSQKNRNEVGLYETAVEQAVRVMKCSIGRCVSLKLNIDLHFLNQREMGSR